MMESNIDTALSTSEIYDALKEDILALRLEPGSKMSEASVAEKYGVSRSPIRKVFNKLESENLLTVLPQKGTFVSLMDFQYITDMIYTRTCVEKQILREIAERHDEAFLQKLERNIAEQKHIIHEGRGAKDFYNADSRFHGMCFAYLDHTAIWELIQNMNVHYTRFRMLDIVSEKRFEILVKEHEDILALLRAANDPDGLSHVIHAHLHGNITRLGAKITSEYARYFKETRIL